MKPIPLKQFVKDVGGQHEAGKQLGIAQPTISLMIKHGRGIYVIPAPSGGMTYYEIKLNRLA